MSIDKNGIKKLFHEGASTSILHQTDNPCEILCILYVYIIYLFLSSLRRHSHPRFTYAQLFLFSTFRSALVSPKMEAFFLTSPLLIENTTPAEPYPHMISSLYPNFFCLRRRRLSEEDFVKLSLSPFNAAEGVCTSVDKKKF